MKRLIRMNFGKAPPKRNRPQTVFSTRRLSKLPGLTFFVSNEADLVVTMHNKKPQFAGIEETATSEDEFDAGVFEDF